MLPLIAGSVVLNTLRGIDQHSPFTAEIYSILQDKHAVTALFKEREDVVGLLNEWPEALEFFRRGKQATHSYDDLVFCFALSRLSRMCSFTPGLSYARRALNNYVFGTYSFDPYALNGLIDYGKGLTFDFDLSRTVQEIVTPTYGAMLFEDQFIDTVQAVVGYCLAESRELLTACRGRLAEEMAKQRSRFLEATRERSVDDRYANTLFDFCERSVDLLTARKPVEDAVRSLCFSVQSELVEQA